MAASPWLLLLLPWMHTLLCLDAAVPPEYWSIDCGGEYHHSSKDSVGLEWISDSNFTRLGVSANVSQPADANSSDFVFSTVRYFPENRAKVCYLLDGVSEGSFYLVRASFWLGKSPIYETQARGQLSFMLLIDADEWANVSIGFPQSRPLFEEMYLQANSMTIAVCLARLRPGTDAPFISSIELRGPLSDNTDAFYVQTTQPNSASSTQSLFSVRNVYRIRFGAQSNATLRYPDDLYDRFWYANQAQPALHTNSVVAIIPKFAPDLPPLPVMQSAYAPHGGFNFSFPVIADSYHSYILVTYIAEIDGRVNGTGQRAFTLQATGQGSASEPFDMYGSVGRSFAAIELYHTSFASGSIYFSFRPASGALYPPCISAVEIFQLFDNPSSNGTFYPDTVALNDLKATVVDLSSWTGDPCLPNGYGYNWLNCSTATPPRITVLSLSNQGLVAEVPPSINSLTGLLEIFFDGNGFKGSIPDLSALKSLQTLNLSDNNLTGPIPVSLSTLPTLQFLSLRNNNLSGPIPKALLRMSQSQRLRFDYDGNPFLCVTSNETCFDSSHVSPSPAGSPGESQHHIGLIVEVVVSALGVTLLVFGAAFYLRRRTHAKPDSRHSQLIRHTELFEASKSFRVFKYSEIEAATQNFSRRLGEGGFGPVYQGQLANGQPIAVKMLSMNSRQGAREFVNEVRLLSRIHHRNLVGLVGYCTDQRLILVYEYMSKGALADCLYGDNKLDIPWRIRLGIAVDAAEGIDYLHRGCTPPIIHRDVKCSNILLSDRLEAKIADFGISRFRRMDESGPFSTAVMGSNGYHDPEYTSPQKLTDKVDVYSFGVVLMEIICGRPPINRQVLDPEEPVYIVERVQIEMQRGSIEEIVDKALGNEYNIPSMWKALEIAMQCVEGTSKRPSMHEVYLELQKALQMELGNAYNVTSSINDSPISMSIPLHTR